MKDKKKMKFIRKNGKIIPIRADGGADLRKAPRYDKKISSEIFKKHGKRAKLGDRVKMGIGAGIGLGSIGSLIGSTVDIARGAKNLKATATGALGGLALGLVAGVSDKSKRMSNRKYNKEFGKAYAKKLKGSSV